MPTILLIRHAENDYYKQGRLPGRLPGVHLNEKGQAQAKALAHALTKMPLKAVYSSPLERTMETAEPIAAAQGLEVTPRPGLLEVEIGEWQGLTLKQLRRRKLWKVVQRNPTLARFPAGESFAEAQMRIVHELEALAAAHKPKQVFACVGHSDMIKLAVAYYLGLPLDLFQRLTVQPASVSTLHLSKSHSRLINLNHTAIPLTKHP
jgi:probable phosphomutase (TIGR03848 family)